MDGFKFPSIDTSVFTRVQESYENIPTRRMWSDEQFNILKKYIQDFEDALDSEHEVGLMLTNFGQSVMMKVEYITYEYPVLMIFKGLVNNRETTLIQHINQLNFMLTSVEKESDSPRKKIGFNINE